MSRNLTIAEREESDQKWADKFAEMWVCEDCGGEFLFGRMTGEDGPCPHCRSPNIKRQTDVAAKPQ